MPGTWDYNDGDNVFNGSGLLLCIGICYFNKKNISEENMNESDSVLKNFVKKKDSRLISKFLQLNL